MFKHIKDGFKGVKRYVDKKVQMCKEILSSRETRLITGIILGGLSAGLIVSAYVPYPS